MAESQGDGKKPQKTKIHKDGCGLAMNVLGIKLEHFEKSRSSKVDCINHKVPDQCLNLLRSDSERRKSVLQYRNQKQNVESNPDGSFFDAKEKEFHNILKRIERIRNHKIDQAQTQEGLVQNAGQEGLNKMATTQVEAQIKQTQKEIDQKRNAQNKKSGSAAGNNRNIGTADSQVPGEEQPMDMDGDMGDANLNIIDFLKQQPKKKGDLKFQRVVMAQGAGTFDDIKQNLDEYNRLGRISMERRTLSRQKRKEIHDLTQQGKDVGSYSPKYMLLEKRATGQSFYGPQRYMSESRRVSLERKLQSQKQSIQDEAKQLANDNANPQTIMRAKRKNRTQMKNLVPSERPDPFKPQKSWYLDGNGSSQNRINANSCHNCIKKGRPFTNLSDWERQKVQANWKFANRVDSHIQDLSKHCPHKTITDGYLKVTDSRFETNVGSTFLGGEITEQSPFSHRLQKRNYFSSKAKSFNAGKATSFSTKNSINLSKQYQNTEDDANYLYNSNLMIGQKRPLVANLANVPTVKIANYSKRNPSTLFYPQGQAPRSSDTEGHGGLFYDIKNYSKLAWSNKMTNVVKFNGGGKVENKKDQIKRIEQITRNTKSAKVDQKKNSKKQMALENAEMLFNMLHGNKQQEKSRDQKNHLKSARHQNASDLDYQRAQDRSFRRTEHKNGLEIEQKNTWVTGLRTKIEGRSSPTRTAKI